MLGGAARLGPGLFFFHGLITVWLLSSPLCPYVTLYAVITFSCTEIIFFFFFLLPESRGSFKSADFSSQFTDAVCLEKALLHLLFLRAMLMIDKSFKGSKLIFLL